ncbi:MAG: ABC transporter substrate-binding protein [Candidatus Marinimicrobia bacterium]|jgi:microcin C transport system substrate-binding protein|nr:ABC transporter substrate-binding protein [Candidatus Neomarinimicrobiota bacterium]
MKIKQCFIYFLTGTIVFIISCGGGEKKSSKKSSGKITVNNKDTTTPAKEGGYGFEKYAEELGYQTYVWSEEKDGTFFGDSRAKKGGTLNYIHSNFPRTMRIIGQNSSQMINTRIIQALCYEALLSQHPATLEFVPSLATHWQISEDKMEFKFRINPDARWSDGMPVVAEDVVATWDIRMDETILEPSEQLSFGKFERPVAESKYIVSVKAKSINWRNFLYFSTMALMPNHILKDLDGTAFLEEYAFSMITGSGAYIIPEDLIRNQESFTLVRRNDYWAADDPMNKYTYNFDKIKVSVVKDNTALEYEKFKKGEQDFYRVSQARVWVEETNYEAIQNGWIQKQRIFSEKPAGTSGYYFNMRKWPFDDKRVRYAFTYLYNREKMNREMYYNEYGMMNSLYAGSVYENPNNNKFHHNPEKAVQLLREAGYTSRNDDGWLVHEESGRILSFELSLPKTYEYMATPVQQMLKEYGMDMQIKFVDYNTMIKNVNERNYTVAMLAYGGLVYPNPETSLKSELADQNDNNNVWGFKSARVDELLTEYDVCFEQKRRVEIIQEIDGIFADVHPTAWSIVRNYQRILYWDKFGFPEWMFTRYIGEFWSIFPYWWIDEEKSIRLENAMETGEKLPLAPLDMKFWPEFLKNQ